MDKLDLKKVTRFEVIDYTLEDNNRIYSKHWIKVEPSIQDDGRTLKIFITEKKEDEL